MNLLKLLNMKYLFFSCFLFMTMASIAQDSMLIQQVFKQIELEEKNCKIDLITTSDYPGNDSQSIVLIPEIEEQIDDYIELNTHIFIVDKQSGKINQQYFESSTTNDWYSDAVKITKIAIDHNPYHLTYQTVAFAVLVHYEGSSRPNPFVKNTISLFVPEADSIQSILKNFVVYQFNGEWDTVCTGEFTEQKKKLTMMLDQSNNGFFNLLIETNITHTTGIPDENEECVFKDVISQKKQILEYKDGLYQ